MIDLPVGKAIVAMNYKSLSFKDALKNRCGRCCFYKPENRQKCEAQTLFCQYDKRKDGKNVIFKIINIPSRKP